MTKLSHGEDDKSVKSGLHGNSVCFIFFLIIVYLYFLFFLPNLSFFALNVKLCICKLQSFIMSPIHVSHVQSFWRKNENSLQSCKTFQPNYGGTSVLLVNLKPVKTRKIYAVVL